MDIDVSFSVRYAVFYNADDLPSKLAIQSMQTKT